MDWNCAAGGSRCTWNTLAATWSTSVSAPTTRPRTARGLDLRYRLSPHVMLRIHDQFARTPHLYRPASRKTRLTTGWAPFSSPTHAVHPLVRDKTTRHGANHLPVQRGRHGGSERHLLHHVIPGSRRWLRRPVDRHRKLRRQRFLQSPLHPAQLERDHLLGAALSFTPGSTTVLEP